MQQRTGTQPTGRPNLPELQFKLLDPKALKLLDFFWQDHSEPCTLRTNAADAWMRAAGIGGRGAFFQCLKELEAHQLIVVTAQREERTKRIAGLSITLRWPPETISRAAFKYYAQKLITEIDRRIARLRELNRLQGIESDGWTPAPDNSGQSTAALALVSGTSVLLTADLSEGGRLLSS
ncbi:MAG TPA: hypothetical protein VKQ30_24995 [Ktedonobacterales bacterium]|nr:hypothetical protein [Ktedonobacterales bacterium]